MSKILKLLKFYFAQNILFLFRKAKNKRVIIEDIRRWQRILKNLSQDATLHQKLVVLFQRWPEFRNLFYFRLRKDPVKNHMIYRITFNYLYPPKQDLSIHAADDIGPGLFIQHGRSSGIVVQRMGANCWINQHVSIGHKGRNNRPPIIGNNVRIASGAKVYGPITIGDNVTVGANAVVVKDVPPDCTVVGVPGRIIKRNGRRVDEPL